MIDVAILRDDPAALEAGLARRSVTIDVAALRTLDGERRAVRADAEELRARQKEGGKAIAGLDGAEKEAAIASAASRSVRFAITIVYNDYYEGSITVVRAPPTVQLAPAAA